MKKNGTHKHNPDPRHGGNWKTQGESFEFVDTYYVDNAIYLLLDRNDLEQAAKLIKNHFRRFGLSVHYGDKRTKEKLKTEIMHIPRPGQESTAEETADVMLNKNEYFGFCKEEIIILRILG